MQTYNTILQIPYKYCCEGYKVTTMIQKTHNSQLIKCLCIEWIIQYFNQLLRSPTPTCFNNEGAGFDSLIPCC